MTIAVFGPKRFEVSSKKIYTFDEFQASSSLKTTSQAVDGKKPSTLIEGSELNAMSLSIRLNASAGVNPRKEQEEWEGIKDAAIAYPFVLGKAPFGSKWMLKNVDMQNTVIDGRGNILSCDLNLKFEEWVRQGKKEKTDKPGVQSTQNLGEVDKNGTKPNTNGRLWT